MDPLVESAIIGAAAAFVGVGGTVAVAIVGYRTSRSTNQATIDAAHHDVQRTLEVSREGQLADRYSRALEQLGSGKPDVQMGGIYALEGIALESTWHQSVMEVLAGFIREHSREQGPLPPSHDAPAPERTTRPDVQRALTVIGRLVATHDGRPIDLTGAHLFRANLTGANLTDVNLTDVNLTSAHLTETNLTHVNLTGADLTGADLTDADLTRATLTGADLTDAKLIRANLTKANLARRSRPPTLPGADLTGADLTAAILTGARFYGATLIRAYFANAVTLDSADLTGADFTGAILIGATWPKERHPPAGWVRDRFSNQLRQESEKNHEAGP